jgi:poly(3-hydroxybutyrate) depolymerase
MPPRRSHPPPSSRRATGTTRRWRVALFAALALVATACGEADDGTGDATGTGEATTTTVDTGTTRDDDGTEDARGHTDLARHELATISDHGGDEGVERWQEELPAAEEVTIPSSVDDHEQGAMWLAPTGDGPQPLLVVLHSWSYGYLQHSSIPFGQLAEENGWAMIHPDYRGVFERPEATGSDLAVADVLDAVDHAVEQADIDTDRIFLSGYSGGGMMALLMAGRYPDRFAAVASWVPIHDLVAWYGHNSAQTPEPDYVGQIEASCGGNPQADPEARQSCEHRSPRAHLDAAREAGVPVYIAHGIDDDVVPPHHAVRAFDQLAAPDDRLGDDAAEEIGRNTLPDDLRGEVDADTHFADEDPEVLFARTSGPVTLVLFDGDHDAAYHPGLEWMVRASAEAGG